jgi:outer membrane beta-barrel protein
MAPVKLIKIMKNHGKIGWGVRVGQIGLGLMIVFWLLLVAASWAEASTSRDRDQEDSEYNFNWLDTDKKIYVLQNRKFIKAGRLMLSGMGGPGETNAYRTTYNVGARMAFYPWELLGVEAFYTYFRNVENSTYDALKIAAPNTMPIVREIRAQYGAMVHYVPWYAKINVFNKILYFDWYFSVGAGTVQTALDDRRTANATPSYQEQSLLGYFLGTGHQYHLTRWLTVRADFMSAFYRAPLFGTTGAETWFSNYQLAFGLGLRI